ncbi:MAG: hypothetical protein ACP5O0_10810 [Acidimicrobiales bacterium]
MECVASLFGALGVVGVRGVSVFSGASVDGELLRARSQTAFFRFVDDEATPEATAKMCDLGIAQSDGLWSRV